MEYRLAGTQDAERLAALRWRHKTEDVPPEENPPFDIDEKDGFLRACADFLRQALREEFACMVAVEKGEIVAHIYIVTVRKLPKPGKLDGRWGYVTAVYTVPEYRNRGIGGALMEWTKAWCRAQGLEALIVWPSERSVPFYGRAGFDGENDLLELEL